MRAEVKSYRTNYLPIVPGEKRPALNSWQGRQVTRPEDNEAEVERWIAEGYWLAAITGKTSDDLVLLDFDRAGVYERWLELVDQELVGSLAVVSTQTPGRYHVWFRAPGYYERWKGLPQDIAADSIGALIELRTGGRIGLVPCQTCDRYQYAIENGVTVGRAPTLDPEEADSLVEAAQALNERIRVDPRNDIEKTGTKDVTKPGVDFSERASIAEVIEPNGWQIEREARGVRYWRRPGKRRGVSATEGYVEGRLYVFSTSCAPLEAGRAYTPFQLKALLDFDGDFSLCAFALHEQGYGRGSVPDGTILELERAVAQVRSEVEHGDEVPLPQIVETKLKKDPQFKAVWGQKVPEFAGDDGRYDCAMIHLLMRAGASLLTIVRALYRARIDRQADGEPALDVKHIGPLVHSCKSTRGTGEVVDAVRDAMAKMAEDHPDPLDRVRKLLNLDIVEVHKVGRHDARYSLLLADGTKLDIGGIETLDTARSFRRVVANLTGRFPGEVAQKLWLGEVATPLLDVAQGVEDEDAELAAMTWNVVVQHFVRANDAAVDYEEDPEGMRAMTAAKRPVIKGGTLYLNAASLLASVKAAGVYTREFQGIRDVTSALRSFGFDGYRIPGTGAKYWRAILTDEQLDDLRSALAEKGVE